MHGPDRIVPLRLPFPVNTNELALVGLLRRDWDTAAPVPAMAMLDWTELIRSALQHGVANLLCRVLQQLPGEHIPEDIVEAARSYLERADAQGAERIAQTFEILDALRSDDIPALPFKGVALAVMAHASPTMRPSRDIDVLVHKDHMGRAVASLAKLGYRLDEACAPWIMNAFYVSNGQAILFAQDRLPVEPHWTFAPISLAVDLDLDGMWRRATALDVAGRRVGSLTPEDTLLVACLHGAKEMWWRLLWVADIAALLHRHRSLDWAAITRRAARSGMLRILWLGLGLARTLFSVKLPHDVARAMDRDAQCVRLIEQSRRRLFGGAGGPGSLSHVSKFHWDVRERASDRARYVWRTMTTPQFIHYRMIALPNALGFGYVAVKLVHDYLLLPVWLLGKGRWWRRSTPPPGDAR